MKRIRTEKRALDNEVAERKRLEAEVARLQHVISLQNLAIEALQYVIESNGCDINVRQTHKESRLDE